MDNSNNKMEGTSREKMEKNSSGEMTLGKNRKLCSEMEEVYTLENEIYITKTKSNNNINN